MMWQEQLNQLSLVLILNAWMARPDSCSSFMWQADHNLIKGSRPLRLHCSSYQLFGRLHQALFAFLVIEQYQFHYYLGQSAISFCFLPLHPTSHLHKMLLFWCQVRFRNPICSQSMVTKFDSSRYSFIDLSFQQTSPVVPQVNPTRR